MAAKIKQEPGVLFPELNNDNTVNISSCSSDDSYDSDSSSDFSDFASGPNKKQRVQVVLPLRFLDPLPSEVRLALQKPTGKPPSFSVTHQEPTIQKPATSYDPLGGFPVKKEIVVDDTIAVRNEEDNTFKNTNVSPGFDLMIEKPAIEQLRTQIDSSSVPHGFNVMIEKTTIQQPKNRMDTSRIQQPKTRMDTSSVPPGFDAMMEKTTVKQPKTRMDTSSVPPGFDARMEKTTVKQPKTRMDISSVPPGFAMKNSSVKMEIVTNRIEKPVGNIPQIVNNELTIGAVRMEEQVGDASQTVTQSCNKQFWKAGDYEVVNDGSSFSQTEGMDHVRVHPRFLHSNATSHKWALGAFAELLDNALDEVCHGATYVHVDVLKNMKDNSNILLVEDNGGGMTPPTIRQCMSLGYSAKSKMANTIGQYGNGFKTSTMRLGADVIVFSRCRGNAERSATQSIGMLSYTFLRSTGKEDIVVPMVHYEKMGNTWNKLMKPSPDACQRNIESIVEWSPYESEEDLINQFSRMSEQGTRIIIYNLWEDDQGLQELDFDAEEDDIQIRGVNRDDKKIEMANKYPNSKHFLTYRHSLRSYTSILYRKIPTGFQIFLRGKNVEYHDIVDDMMFTDEITYKPLIANVPSKDVNMVAAVKIGFVKDAHHHIDVQGFNVYHKNRLIKPFWRVWNPAGSDGRGVIGVLDANFVEPAHDKQGFERTVVLSRLENKLASVQKTYWTTKCHLIGYAPRGARRSIAPYGVASKPAYRLSSSTTPPIINTMGPSASITSTYATAVGPSASKTTVRVENTQTSVNASENVKKEQIEGDNLPVFTPRTDMELKLHETNAVLRKSLQTEIDKNKSLQNQVSAMELEIKQLKQQMETIEVTQEEHAIAALSEEKREDNLRKRLREASGVIHLLVKKIKVLEAPKRG